MLGTAFPASKILLVEQPGPWGRAGLTNSHFDPFVAGRLLERFEQHGVRVLSIRRPGRSDEQHLRRWGLSDCRLGRESMVWGTFGHDAELLDVPLEPTTPGPVIDPAGSVFLVCTHGSHDACCALRGRPVAAALRDLRPERVWECSHVGGDRFAANVLVLPSGTLYGSVHVSETAELIAVTERGEVLPGPLRGKVGLVPEAQAALAHAQQQWGGGAAGFRIRSVTHVDGSVTRVRVERDGEPITRVADVSVRRGRSPVHRLTCQMTNPATVFTYHAEGMTEL